jgi:hypothetical protein
MHSHIKTTKTTAMILGFVFLALSFVYAQSPVKRSITIKLLNGKTGRPIWWRGSPYIFVGEAINEGASNLEARAKVTNFLGEVKIDVTGAHPPLVKVWVDFISRDCRFSQSQAQPKSFTYSGSTLQALPTYSIEEITTKGVVSENYCSAAKRPAKPGVLMIYVVPASLRELWYE